METTINQQEDWSRDPRWVELSAQCTMLQKAVEIAWGNVVEAYRTVIEDPETGSRGVTPEVALAQYQIARSLHMAAEKRLLEYLERGSSRF